MPYIHPVCSFLPESRAASLVRNETGEPLNCVYLLAEYDQSGKCVEVMQTWLTIPAYGTVELTAPPGDTPSGQFLCDAATWKLLVPARMKP